MIHRRTKTVLAVLVSAILIMFPSCQGELQNVADGPVKVGVYAGGSQTRTQMTSNGLSAVWEAGDELAVWAKNSSGSYVIENQRFRTYGLDAERGFFTSTLSSAMPDGTYTYYCSYPAPISVNGTDATFNLPSVQDGKVTSGADIMIATPVQRGPLTAVPESEDHSGISMTMNRMMHQFRFYIPGDNAVIGSEEITKLELSFPREVCGKVTMNLADPTDGIVLTDASRAVVLELADPIGISDESEGVYEYACVAIAPTSFFPGESLSIRAFTKDKIAKFDAIDLCARTFESGHSTPVRLIVKELVDFPYSIKFTLTGNNVGEEVTSVRFIAPSGCNWPTNGTNDYTYCPEGGVPVGSEVVFRFPDYADYAAFSSQNITIELETENTISSSVAGIGTIPSGVEKHTSTISAAMPYLLYQDFSAISNYSDGHDNPTVGTNSDTYTGITELSSAGLTGWYGTRVGIQTGTSARICCRYESVKVLGLGSSAYYKGRLYTPKLSMIKEGKDIQISVSFKYGSNRNEKKPTFSSKPDKSPIMYFGMNTQDVVTNPDESEGDILDSITGLISGSGYANPTPSSLSPMVIQGEYLDKENGSYTNLPKSKTLTIGNVDRDMRLGWIITTDNTASNTNANYWLYIDEIKVQIKK